MNFSAKLFHMALELSGFITEDSSGERAKEINQIIKDLLLLSLKTDRHYGKCEKAFDILGGSVDFDLRIENCWIYYDAKARVCGGPCTVLGQIICAWTTEGWDITFARFNGVPHHEVLDKRWPKIRKVMGIKDY